ncbi:bacterial PH domain protein [Bacillus clarus]|uniref:Bacterial PH domain protein n=1 Tax=Bacillus clarus TaxID=2338372 RepID=A0A090Z5J3_9BACI|nr:bacterial PH domain protein [Bacillus clarus]
MVISNVIVVVGACFAPIIVGSGYFLLFLTVPFAVLFIWGWFTTKYIVKEDQISIKSGLVKKQVFIKDIKQISNTKNPLAAPALSFDRLEILYGSYETEFISPKDKLQFISYVKSKNSQIEIK